MRQKLSNKISIVIPTYKEAANIAVICLELHKVLTDQSMDYEIVIIDDNSQDGTESEVSILQTQGIAVELIIRKAQRGLSSAVLDGIDATQGDIVVVMDADLSHPCATIPQMVVKLTDNQADFVIGSRYIAGGSFDHSWGWARLLNSKVATWLARLLVRVKDPMSGFFAFRKVDAPARHLLSPIGYKIGLELMVKGRKVFRRIAEVPIHFQDRQRGNSKMSFIEQLKYLRHLRRLYAHAYPTLSEITQFALVGSIGFTIDLLLYFTLQTAFGLSHLTARGLSFWGAASCNWILNRVLTFSHYQKTPRLEQWLLFLVSSLVGFTISWGSYTVMTLNIGFFMEFKILALFLGVVLGMGFNFVFCQNIVFKPLQQKEIS